MIELPDYELDLMVKTAAEAGDKEKLRQLHRIIRHPLFGNLVRPDGTILKMPREDHAGRNDQQTSFAHSRDRVAICSGGNASGKTEAAAYHVAQYLLNWQEPPRVDTPFWVISDTYEQCCGVCWQEKLSKYIPAELIDWPRISWYRPNRNWPFSVPLTTRKKHPRTNWVIEFKSYEQGREKMQARSIGGFWFSEQFPWDIFVEVLRGCRDYMFKGGQIAEFTPVDPAKAVEIGEIYRNWVRNPHSKRGWNFYRLNTVENVGVSDEWRDIFFQTVSEEMQATRMTGEFARYEGAIYQTFDPAVHLRSGVEWQNCKAFRRGIDWGASVEHPFVCLFLAQDGNGQWRVFDEYRSTSQESAMTHAIQIIQRHPWPGDADSRYGTTWADPSRPDNITLFAEMGIDVTPANNSVDAGIETVRHALKINPGTSEPGLIIDEDRCPNLAKNIATYRWLQSSRKGLNPNAARPQPLKYQDDECDALRYVLFSERTITGATPDSLRLDLRKRESIQAARLIDSGATGLYPCAVDASGTRERRTEQWTAK